MGTITLNIEDKVEKRFREVASTIYNKKRGYLGEAATKAMKLWVEEGTKSAEVKAVDLLEEGFDMGKIKFKNRDELHER